MHYTNKHGLPEEVYKVLSKERYVKGEGTDYSITTLKTPPRIVQLERRYWDELEEDCIDNLWSMFGNMAHNLLEEHGSDDAVTEQRLYTTIQDRVISGQLDHYKDGVITDYKVTSAWTLVYGSRIREWEEQLNSYAYLCTVNSLPVRKIRIVAILRDWDKNKAKEQSSYPQTPIVIIPITLWDSAEAQSYVEERVFEHKEAEDKADWALPLCTEEDMWCSPTKYAVFKGENKRATKVFDDESDIFFWLRDEMGWIKETIDGHVIDVEHRIERRQGKRTRCESYCRVNSKCNVYQEYLNASL